MATGTASPSTVAWATARRRVGTAWYAALNDVRDVPSLNVRSVDARGHDQDEHDRGARTRGTTSATMIAPSTVSTPTAFAVNP